jgi:hypothetical protein
MKRVLSILLLALAFVCFGSEAFAQCKNFAKGTCRPKLAPYIHDGIYNATELSEGESAELFKTFYAGQQYRIAVCSDGTLPPVRFEIMDADRNVLFSNSKDAAGAQVWDFKLEVSQQLIVKLEVGTNDDKASDQVARGCVAVLVGFSDK